MIQFGLRLHDAEQLPMEQLLPLVKEKGFTSAHLALSKAMKEYPCDPSALTPGYALYLRHLFEKNGIDVAVLGNGEYALHEVQALLPVAKSVALLTNGAPLTADFPPEVTVYPQAVEAVLGETVVTGVQLSGGVQLPVSGVFVALGVAGSTALARKIGAEVDGNRIVVDEKMQTTVPGLYAAGDCTGGLLQVAKAVYEGAQAGTEAAKALRKG